MYSFLILVLACNPPSSEPEQTVGPSPRERAVHIQAGLTQAHQEWLDGNRVEAQARVSGIYGVWFEPLEEELRIRDPMGTLELEYAFGRLAAHLGRSTRRATVQKEVEALRRAIDIAVETIPEPAALEAAALPPPAAAPMITVDQQPGTRSPG